MARAIVAKSGKMAPPRSRRPVTDRYALLTGREQRSRPAEGWSPETTYGTVVVVSGTVVVVSGTVVVVVSGIVVVVVPGTVVVVVVVVVFLVR